MKSLRLMLLGMFVCCLVSSGFAQEASELIGRWDLTVKGADGEFPSWIEVRKSGNATLVGAYCGQFGSARPVAKFHVDGNKF